MVRTVSNIGSCKFMTLLWEEVRSGQGAAGGSIGEAAWSPPPALH